ncbi:MAG: disulfide reductase [Candidatus Acididesulfobacter diazotrophicus]|jgi:heterodisulfide reductase subunit B|uniref:Disulfide reductase n=1 Tax=Candidatus Acididesulfobacter diazotrophicus TaxID=2597226 RepID=A0A519BPU0_9DELT|nr:MAG: disulfide reductase [Candidatus Acididesulfobacter diazotrophicus]
METLKENQAAYYPGCALLTIDRAYNNSSKLVSKKMGIELVEIPDYNCCGIGEMKSKGAVSLYLPLRNMTIAKSKLGSKDLVMACSVCYHEFTRSITKVKENKKLLDEVNLILKDADEEEYAPEGEARHILEFLYNEKGPDEVKKNTVKPLKGIKVAPYYGCLYTRPSMYTFADKKPNLDNSEKPHFMHDFLESMGAEVVSYGNEVQCCGGRNVVQDEETSFTLCSQTLSKAKKAGADFLVVICPKCAGALDVNQPKIVEKYGEDSELPVVYLTQLMALAFGFSEKDAQFSDMISNPLKVLKEKGGFI